jgi:hypothetical protein
VGWFIFGIIIAVGGVICLVSRKAADENERWIPTSIGSALLVLAFVLYAVSGLKSVPVKNIGIPQSFNTVGSGVYTPGTHETWTPWLHLTDVDETVQSTTFRDAGNDNGTSCKGGMPVRIGGQQTACINITIQWQVKPQAAGSLFSDYANQGNLMTAVTSAVVVRELEEVTNDVMGDYNPITDVASVTNSSSQASQFSTFSPTILNDMRAAIGNRINILSILLLPPNYSTSVEQKLQAIQQAYANEAVATENVKVNEQNSLALQKLGTPSQSQLEAECLTDMKDGMSAPTAFQCFPGASSGVSVSAGH